MSTQDWSRLGKGRRFKGDVDANSISIGAIVLHYGGEVREGKNIPVKCCLHNDTHRSAVIDTVSNLYFCHTCGKGGNAANIVCILESMEFNDGLKRAVEIATGSGAEIRSRGKSANSRRTKRTWNL